MGERRQGEGVGEEEIRREMGRGKGGQERRR